MKTTREEYDISFDGKSIKNHEMDLGLLLLQLENFKKLVEVTNRAVNKNTQVNIKVKSNFKEGSLIVSLIAETVAPIVPIMPDIISATVQIIKLKDFLKGKSPKETKTIEGGKVEITNAENGVQVFHEPVFNIVNSSNVNIALNTFAMPIKQGKLEKISFQNEKTKTIDTPYEIEDVNTLLCDTSETKNISQSEKTLEVLTTNTDGKADGWRFHDIEDAVTFKAQVLDEEFLDKVVKKHYNFQNEDQIQATVEVEKTTKNNRTTTIRRIIEVKDFTRGEDSTEIEEE